MDRRQYSRLLDVFADVPAPRKARGKQLDWTLILGIIAAGLLCQQRSPRAMAQWAISHRRVVLTAFRPQRRRIPSAATLRRALRYLDVPVLEQRLQQGQATASVPPARLAPRWQGLAIDGKALRGARAHGQPTHLVSLVRHDTATVAGQTAVARKRNEISAAPLLLRGRALQGVVLTMDALLTQRKLAAQILAQGDHYLMVVKRNQRRLAEDLSWFFHTPPLPCEAPWRAGTSVTKGHGRLETRQVTCTADLDDYLAWPGVRQVLRRTCQRIILKTGEVSASVTSGLTSLEPTEATPAELAALWQGHWTIENRSHDVRDVTLGEDGSQIHTGTAPQALAALRNAILTLVRAAAWTNIADALRYYNNHPGEALRLLHAPLARL